MIFRRKKTAERIEQSKADLLAFELASSKSDAERATQEAYRGLRRALYMAINASRDAGRNPSIVLLGRVQYDILQAKLDEQWEAYEKSRDMWKESPPAFTVSNGQFFRSLRIVLVADADLLQVFEGIGEWK